jgi:putative ABC transport system permease protein
MKELHASWKAIASVIVILWLGFLGPLLTSTVRSSTESFLQNRSREILSADLALSSLRAFTDLEKQTAERVLKATRWAEEIDFVSMAVAPTHSTLCEIQAIGSGYPIYGEIRIRKISEDGSTKTTAETARTDDLQNAQFAWAYPETLLQLGLHLGDTVQLGKLKFKVIGEVQDSAGISRSGFGFAPRIYIAGKFAQGTGLLQYGSQIFHRLYFALPTGISTEQGTALIKTALPDPDIFIRTPADAVEGFQRFLSFFSRYLGVITMVVFSLSWVSAFYILQIFVQDHLKNAAVLMILGASRGAAAWIYILQILGVAAAGFLLAVLTTVLLTLLAPMFAGDLLPVGFVLSIHLKDLLALLGISLASTLALSLPLLIRLRTLQINSLFSESSTGVGSRSSAWMQIAIYIPIALIFLLLAYWLMASGPAAFALAGGLIAVAALSWWLGRLLFRFLFALVRRQPGSARLILVNLARSRFGVGLCFLALTLLALILGMLPHLLLSVTEEITPASHSASYVTGRPALFVFNIPEKELEPLKKFAQENAAELRYVSPLILARLTQVNGKESTADFFLKFPVRVSYREQMISSEKIIFGRPIQGRYDANRNLPAEISMEERYAERWGFQLGDILDFDVQGFPVQGKIVGLRRVRWSDFHPNFFMEFQPGVLDDLPKTWISNVQIPNPENKAAFQMKLLQNFPGLSVIDVGQTITHILDLSESLVGPVQLTAWLAVGMSFLILFFIISHNLRLRTPELDIEKILGARSSYLKWLLIQEYLLLSLLAVIMGAAAGAGVALYVTTHFLDIEFHLAWSQVLISALVLVLLTSVLAGFSASRVLRQSQTAQKL